jgi:hypothetical protein
MYMYIGHGVRTHDAYIRRTMLYGRAHLYIITFDSGLYNIYARKGRRRIKPII